MFTALADEYSVSRISETLFVHDETCSHPNQVYYAAPSSAMHVYTMEVKFNRKRSSELDMSGTLIPDHSTSNVNAHICIRNQSAACTEVFTACKMSNSG